RPPPAHQSPLALAHQDARRQLPRAARQGRQSGRRDRAARSRVGARQGGEEWRHPQGPRGSQEVAARFGGEGRQVSNESESFSRSVPGADSGTDFFFHWRAGASPLEGGQFEAQFLSER